MRIGELARQAGATATGVRYYESPALMTLGGWPTATGTTARTTCGCIRDQVPRARPYLGVSSRAVTAAASRTLLIFLKPDGASHAFWWTCVYLTSGVPV